MNVMHPVMVLVAFAIAALVTYALVLAALSATSALSRENQDDTPDDRHHPRESPDPVPNLAAGTHLPPWVPAGGDPTLHKNAPADVPAPHRRSRVHC